jgi:hypothetical protein
MKKKNPPEIIPPQQTGRAIDVESIVRLDDEYDAKVLFEKVKERLQNVNQWKEYAGNISASFQLVDKSGVEVNRKVEKGDYFKIDIPGPGSKSGEGFDWVQLETIESTTGPDSESFGFRVRPTGNPQSNEDDIAHFYSHESTSSFIVQREGNKITASVHDRNTKPNIGSDRSTDKIRDVVVGAAGALSFSKIQWEKLTDGLLRK